MNKSASDGLCKAERVPGELGRGELASLPSQDRKVTSARAGLADSTDKGRVGDQRPVGLATGHPYGHCMETETAAPR